MKKILLITLSCIFNLHAQKINEKIVSAKNNKYNYNQTEKTNSYRNLSDDILLDKLGETQRKALGNLYVKVDRDKYMPQVYAVVEGVLKANNVIYKGTRNFVIFNVLRNGKIAGFYLKLNADIKGLDIFDIEEIDLKIKKLKLDPKYIEWDKDSQFVQVIFPLNF